MKTHRPPTLPVSLRKAALLCAVPLGSLLVGPSASAAIYYWDSDGNAAAGVPPQSTPGSGTWDLSSALWNLGGISGSDVAWVAGSDAVFAGADGAYTVTLGSPSININSLSFNNSGYTLSAASASKVTGNGATIGVTVAAGKVATIGNNVTVEDTNAASSGVLNLNGGSNLSQLIIDSGGAVRATASGGAVIYIGSNATTAGSAQGAVVQVKTGGVISGGNSIAVNGALNITGGSVSSGVSNAIVIGSFADAAIPGVANLTISSGTASAGSSGVRFGTAGGAVNSGGALNLDGGTLVTSKIFAGSTASSSTVNFNGGTLKTSVTNNTDFLGSSINNAVVKAGGALIDTAGFNVTISKGLSHDAGVTTDGGLTKLSNGTLTLSASNGYNGATTVSAGTLLISGALTSSESLSVSNGATLSLGNAISLNDNISMSLVSGATLNLGFASGSETIGTLYLNGSAVAAGTYTAAQLSGLGSGVTFTSSGGSLIVSAVPEPSTWLLLGLGAVATLFAGRRRLSA